MDGTEKKSVESENNFGKTMSNKSCAGSFLGLFPYRIKRAIDIPFKSGCHFYPDESFGDFFETEIYSEEGLFEASESDGLSPEEEAFMFGYISS